MKEQQYNFHKFKRVHCKDGFNISVQAGDACYCLPRGNDAPWTHVECGFPSEEEPLLAPYAEDSAVPTDTVYGYVPVQVVTNVIAKHGGMVDGEAPAGVVPLKAKKE